MIGREDELRELEHALARCAAGHGSVVLVSGEAGIGKTRLCDEISRVHRDSGGPVILGRAFPEDADVSFGPLADTLRAARRAHAPLWNAAQARARLLSPIVPELAAAASAGGESFDRPVLLEGLLDTVEEAGGDAVSLWILDDIHWADDSTWDFVKYATRRVTDMKLTLVATYREEEVGPTHAWWARLAWLKRDPNVVAVRLGRLDAGKTELLVRALAPALPDDVIADIVERSAGTPLLAQELTSLAAQPGALPLAPDIVHATVRQRAAGLGPAARDLLDVAAVAGLDVDEDLLGSLRPAGPVEELISAGLLEHGDGKLRFRHPLMQQAAYEELPPARRRALHQEVARAVENRGGHLAERVAAHLERAAQPEAALGQLEASAAQARNGGNVGRAASLSLVSLALVRRHQLLAGREDDVLRASIADLFRAGRWIELDPLVRGAWVERDRLPSRERAWLANVIGLHLFWSGAVAEASAVVDDEIANLERTGALNGAAMLLAQAGFMAWFRGEARMAIDYSGRALEIAQRTGDAEAECRARNAHVLATYLAERDRHAAAQRHRENAAFARAQALTVGEANALWSLSHFTATLEDYELAERAAERAGIWYAGPARLMKGSIHLMEGRADEAERIFIQVGKEIRLGIPAMGAWMDLEEACLFLHRGELDHARRLLAAQADTEGARLTFWASGRSATLGWLAWEEEQWETAAFHLSAAAEAWPLCAYHRGVGGPILLPLHVDSLMRLGRRVEAAGALAAANSVAHDPDRFFAAALAAARLRLAPSPEGASEADDCAAAAPWPWLRGQVGCWRGELLHDPEAAHAGHDLFEQIGAYRGIERADAVLRRLGVASRRPAKVAGALSARELEVAALVAQGFSNPAIARRLYLSRPTVASHIGHILTKLDFSSRAQIAAWMARRGRTDVDESAGRPQKSSS
jgi:DNA-binding CsgD family transcriptional regulator